MKRIEPPATATWLLEHFSPGKRNEALAGDLLEEFQNGRTAGWYWSQVLGAVALGWFRESLAHPSVLFFAALWSIAAPSWYVLTDKIQNDLAINGSLSGLPFPWSLIGYFGWPWIVWLSFSWMGAGLYLFFQICITRNFHNLQLRRRLLVSLSVYLALYVGMCLLAVFLLPGHGIDRRTLSPLNAITDLRMYAWQSRFFSLVTVFFILCWERLPGPKQVDKSMTRTDIERRDGAE
jgi:hypothetical protein